MLKLIFIKVQKHDISKINLHVIWTIFLECSILLELFWSLKKCKIYNKFFRSSCVFIESKMVAHMQQKVTSDFFFGFSKKKNFFNLKFYAL